MEQLKFFLENLLSLTGIPCRIWSTESSSWVWDNSQTVQSITNTNQELTNQFLDMLEYQKTPLIYSEHNIFYTGICSCWEGYKAVLGPVAIIEPNSKEIREFKKTYHISLDKDNVNISVISLSKMARTLAIIYNHYSGETVNHQDIVYNNQINLTSNNAIYDYRTETLDNSDDNIDNLSYYYSTKVKQQILNGDYERLLKEVDTVDFQMLGEFTAASYKTI